jgi:OOP family OmpA-OmpF porin
LATPESGGGAIGRRLAEGASAVLEDLVFGSGSSELADGSYASLAELADWLAQDPQRRVVLVGHTDASGGLAANDALSQARAESVRNRLITRHGVAAAQVTAEGVGSLAPRDTNATDEGRARNRRVEVMPATAG